MPDDHALPVSGVEHDLLRLRQAGGGGRRAKALGKILNRALRDVEQRDEGAVAKECVKHEPLQSAHSVSYHGAFTCNCQRLEWRRDRADWGPP